jgi:hypothetical protein
MIQRLFAERAAAIVSEDPGAIGLAAAGSWLSNELDEYSDLDLVLVTKHKLGGDKERMIAWAQKFGTLLSAFTGEHVAEPRLLICLYDDPLLHVDIKFLTLEEPAGNHCRMAGTGLPVDRRPVLDMDPLQPHQTGKR